jgi:hypothetical protein
MPHLPKLRFRFHNIEADAEGAIGIISAIILVMAVLVWLKI